MGVAFVLVAFLHHAILARASAVGCLVWGSPPCVWGAGEPERERSWPLLRRTCACSCVVRAQVEIYTSMIYRVNYPYRSRSLTMVLTSSSSTVVCRTKTTNDATGGGAAELRTTFSQVASISRNIYTSSDPRSALGRWPLRPRVSCVVCAR